MSRDAEIAIVGGGMVGTCLASLLARSRALPADRILLIEPRLPVQPRAESDIDLRVSAISRATQRILTACNVWDGLSAERSSPYERMCVWDAAGAPDGEGAIQFDSAAFGQPDLGCIVENRRLQWALLNRARQDGIRVVEAQVQGLDNAADGVRIELQDARRLAAGLVVAADGADSPTRGLLQIETTSTTHGQAIVTHVRTAKPHQRTAWQRFLPTGPIALLPLHDGRSSIVWSTTVENAQQLMAESDAGFCQAVEAATGAVLGRIEACGPRADFSLRSGYAAHYVGARFALVGDAAHSVHPLAGQGVNLGFLDAAALTQVVVEALTAGEEPGELKVLRRYERWRKGENLLMLAALDGLNRLFSNDSRSLSVLRRAGLSLVNRMGPVKTLFMRRALGLQGDLPRLASGDLWG